MSAMDLSRHPNFHPLVLHDSRGDALARQESFPLGLFCAAPTVLEAINRVLHAQGLPVLWVQSDGTIGPADPLLLRIEYVPNPFVC